MCILCIVSCRYPLSLYTWIAFLCFAVFFYMNTQNTYMSFLMVDLLGCGKSNASVTLIIFCLENVV